MKCNLEKLLQDSGDLTARAPSVIRTRQPGEKFYFNSKWGPVPVSATRLMASRRAWAYLAPEDMPKFIAGLDWNILGPYSWRIIVAKACELALAQGLE